MRYWLIKTEPDVFSWDDLLRLPNQSDMWEGIRNYQARNFIRDDIKMSDICLFYHSNCKEGPHVVGVVEVVKEAYPDDTAWDPKSKYYDPKSGPDNPRWLRFDVKAQAAFKQLVYLKDLKANEKLEDMKVVMRGQRLSIQPVTKKHFDIVCRMGGLI